MKKLLLATAAFALIAPAAQAEIKLDLGGFFKGYAGFASNDVTADGSTRDFDIKRKSQVFFQGETTLDNGLTVGYNGQLMQDNNVDPGNAGADNAIEQSYLYFSGNWGRVNLGRENGAAYLLQVTAPASDANLDGSDIEFSFFNTGAANVRQDYAATGALTSATTPRGEDFQYADKITYLTPKFNGFQAGVSYTPEVAPRNQSSYFGNSADTDGGFQDLMEAAVRYDGEFSGVGMHLGAGYTQADAESTGGAQQDFEEWNMGAKFTYEAFGFGAAYTEREGSVAAQGTPVGDVDTWVVGADYTYGAYTFGATYLNSEGDAVGGGSDDYDRYAVGSSYTFGPGMKFNGSVAYHDLSGATESNETYVFAVGTDIQF